jgi:hypothetical protein
MTHSWTRTEVHPGAVYRTWCGKVSFIRRPGAQWFDLITSAQQQLNHTDHAIAPIRTKRMTLWLMPNNYQTCLYYFDCVASFDLIAGLSLPHEVSTNEFLIYQLIIEINVRKTTHFKTVCTVWTIDETSKTARDYLATFEYFTVWSFSHFNNAHTTSKDTMLFTLF